MAHRSVVLTTHSMYEADALCSSISIMVEGQIRALGTKQRLKSEFGSGYEVVVKGLDETARSAGQFTEAKKQFRLRMADFLTSLFPGTTLIANSGGLLTFRVLKEEMDIGKAFDSLHKSSAALGVEYFTISQPTLEQVFIRTVKAHTTKKKGEAVEESLEEADGVAIPVAGARRGMMTPDEEYYLRRNKCNCLTYQLKLGFVGVLLFFILFFILSGPYVPKSNVVDIIIILFVWASFFTCCGLGCVLCCPCCKMPAVED